MEGAWLAAHATWILITCCGIVSLFWERLQAVVFSVPMTALMLLAMPSSLLLGIALHGPQARDLMDLGVMLPLAFTWLGACIGRRRSRRDAGEPR